MPGKYYVYVHRKQTDGSIFYVGKGCGSRDKDRSGRNRHWKNVVAKHGFSWARVSENMSHYCALSLEKALIAWIGIDKLANLKSGDLNGCEHSDESKRKMSRAKKGAKRPQRTHSHRMAIAASLSVPIISSNGETFKNGIEAEAFLRANGYPTASRGNISSVINGNLDRCYDRTWARVSDGIPDYLPYVSVKRKTVIRSDGEEFCSASHAARSVNGSQGNISSCCRGERKVAYGYSWKYK